VLLESLSKALLENQYRHIPLPSPRHFRVIYLEASAHVSSPLSCHLEVVSWGKYPDQNPEYTALSYSWDAQAPSRQIQCNGHILLITPNCEAALRRLRHSEIPKTLWIDSICIDQSPEAIDERSQQVNMMSEIYRNASHVVVWLGESDSRTEKALNRLMELSAELVDTLHENRRRNQQEFRDRVKRLVSRKYEIHSRSIYIYIYIL
jgi:hypothetical protein